MLDECFSYNDELQTYEESSEAKKSTALATSFASPKAPVAPQKRRTSLTWRTRLQI